MSRVVLSVRFTMIHPTPPMSLRQPQKSPKKLMISPVTVSPQKCLQSPQVSELTLLVRALSLCPMITSCYLGS